MEPSQTGAVGYSGPYHTIFSGRGLRTRLSVATMEATRRGMAAPLLDPSPACRREPAMLADSEIRNLLARARTIAVVGLSENPYRDSYGIARFLQRSGYRVLPVNPNLSGPVLGEQPYASLRDIEEHVDIVDIFRRPEFVPDIVEAAIRRKAKAIWMQFGVGNQAAALRAREAGLDVFVEQCILQDHQAYFG